MEHTRTPFLEDQDWLQSIKECSHCSHNLSTAWFIQPLTNSHVINSPPIRLFAFSFSLRHRAFHPLFAVSYLFGFDNYQRHCLYLGAFNTYMEMEVPLIGMYSTENLTFYKNEGFVKLLSLTTLNHWWCWNIHLITSLKLIQFVLQQNPVFIIADADTNTDWWLWGREIVMVAATEREKTMATIERENIEGWWREKRRVRRDNEIAVGGDWCEQYDFWLCACC